MAGAFAEGARSAESLSAGALSALALPAESLPAESPFAESPFAESPFAESLSAGARFAGAFLEAVFLDVRFFRGAGLASPSPPSARSSSDERAFEAALGAAFFLRVTFFLRGASAPSEMAPKGRVPSALLESFDVT